MNRSEVIDYLAAHKSEFQAKFGVITLALVGSFARDEATDQSDIDIVVEIQSENKFRSYFGLLHELEDTFHRRIDLAVESALKPLIRQSITKDAIYL